MHLERCSFTDFAVDRDVPTALLQYSVHRCQPEPRSLTRFLRCEKRLKEARLYFRSHSATRIADRYARVTARMRTRISAAIFLVQCDFRYFDRESSSRRHGVPRIDHEIHDHLLELCRIGAKMDRLLTQIDRQMNVFSQHAAEKIFDLLDVISDIDNSRLQHLLPAERQ